jgi:hypothetical protein
MVRLLEVEVEVEVEQALDIQVLLDVLEVEVQEVHQVKAHHSLLTQTLETYRLDSASASPSPNLSNHMLYTQHILQLPLRQFGVSNI